MVSVWVQYASDDGLVTASDLISMIHNWLLDSGCGCVAIEGSTLQLSRGCCTNGTNLNESCPHSIIGSISSDAEVKVETIVGGIVGGIALTTCIGAIVICR